MLRTFLLLSVVGIVLACTAVTAQTENTKQTKEQARVALKVVPEVTVYYFHTERRCATCLALEKTTSEFIEREYTDGPRVTFKSVNIEEPKNEALANKYQAAGSMLLVVRGDKTEDITTEGFKYARTAPKKLESHLKNAIASMLK